jgi:hypothetical protein
MTHGFRRLVMSLISLAAGLTAAAFRGGFVHASSDELLALHLWDTIHVAGRRLWFSGHEAWLTNVEAGCVLVDFGSYYEYAVVAVPEIGQPFACDEEAEKAGIA